VGALAGAFEIASFSSGSVNPDAMHPCPAAAITHHHPEDAEADKSRRQRILAYLPAQIGGELASAAAEELGACLVDDMAQR